MKNKIFITGVPRSGKSVLMEKIVSNFKNKKGFLTKEITKNNQRIGFEVITNEGKKSVLADIEFKTPYKVSKYFVDVEKFEKTIDNLFDFKENQLLYIDEIGEMELFSEKFKDLVTKYLDSENFFIATLTAGHYSDEFIESIRKRKDVEIIEITYENREEKYKEILSKLEVIKRKNDF